MRQPYEGTRFISIAIDMHPEENDTAVAYMQVQEPTADLARCEFLFHVNHVKRVRDCLDRFAEFIENGGDQVGRNAILEPIIKANVMLGRVLLYSQIGVHFEYSRDGQVHEWIRVKAMEGVYRS